MTRRLPIAVTVVAAGVLLALFTVSQHVKARHGLPYLEGEQLIRHHAVLAGQAGNPWQYRVLSEALVEGVIRIFRAAGVRRYNAIAFITFRVVEDALMFCVAFLYYRRLGLSIAAGFLGMTLLAWSTSYAHYDADLQFSTYADVSCYLLAGWCLVRGAYGWIVPLSLVAALNRETSGLIPFLFLAFALLEDRMPRHRTVAIFTASLALSATALIILRLFFERQGLILPDGFHPGLAALYFNFGRIVTWDSLFSTLGLVPLIAVAGYSRWPRSLRIFFWTIVPVRIVVHAGRAVMAEARLFLVPQALVFIPAALLSAWRDPSGSPNPRA